MLNISHNSIKERVDFDRYTSLRSVESRESNRMLIWVISSIFGLILLTAFLPWTQNVRTKGEITTLRPDQRPQTIHSAIPGRIEKWYVQEGDFVQEGDTILYISEIKSEYLDPELISRTNQQLEAKKKSYASYISKSEALEDQIKALEDTKVLKLEQVKNKFQQARLKVISDSTDYEASIINYDIADEQYKRIIELYNDGLKSLTDTEKRKLNLRKAEAEMISYQNKLLASRNELINAEVELSSTSAQYDEKIAKARSDRYTALSNAYDAETSIAKLENEVSNYSLRNELYYIQAPQNGYVTQAIQSGIGETIKEGDQIISIMPADIQLAVEMYVRPIDLPLIQKGQHVRIQFDGWPAIVFSGWPNTSYGTYGGEVFAIDNFTSKNGLYRVLVAPDPQDVPWPEALRVGSGSISMVLLDNVPVWYELWRQVNGFPPNFYAANATSTDSKRG